MSGPRIGLVDDDAPVLRAIGRVLRAAGFTVTAFASAEELLAAGEPPEFDCLVLDVHLGGLSGFELEEHLLASGQSIPVVFITAHDTSATLERLRRSSTAECLRKPVDDETLIAAMNRAIGRRAGPAGTRQ